MSFEEVLTTAAALAIYVGTPAFILTAVALHRRLKRRLADGSILAPLARELGGEVARDPAAPMPFTRLDVGGFRAYLSLWPFSPTSSRIICLLEIRAGCEAFLEATPLSGRRMPTWNSRIGYFDSSGSHIYTTSNPRFASWACERGLFELLRRSERRLRRPLRVQLTASRITLEAEGLLPRSRVRALREVAAETLDILELAPISRGIDILEFDFAADTGRCPVCGVHAAPPVPCIRCLTPHHAECWAYLGRCGIFGCSGTRLSG